jgi:molybdate transport system regulatory protein
MKRLRAKCKLWLSSKNVEGVFGDGKWRLLEAIDRTGSLSAASESLRISYRKAWGDLNKAQDALNTSLVEKQRGGNRGGRTILTSQGKKWLKAYAKFRADVEKAVGKSYEKHIRRIVE